MITKNDVVAVVLGGPSSEAEISRVTGGAIAAALRSEERRVWKECRYRWWGGS